MKSVIFKSLAILVGLAMATTASAQQGPNWRSNFLSADTAGELTTCTAEVVYSNAAFVVRLYGEQMDFLYYRNDFTLPYGQTLGAMTLEIDGQMFSAAAFTFDRTRNDTLSTTQSMQIFVLEEEYSSLFAALRFGSRFNILFPNGDSYPVTLRGSSNALAAASNCWRRNSTGPLENNPFEGGESDVSSEGGNPFGDL